MQGVPSRICQGQTTAMIGDFNAHSNIWDAKVRIPMRESMIMEVMGRKGWN